jgi:hypothetical protein
MLSDTIQKLKASLSCCTFNGAQHSDILIKETDSLSTLKKVTIKTPNGDWFAFNPDKGRKCPNCRAVYMSPLLSTGKSLHHHRACDHVIIFQQDEKLIILYIELKSIGNSIEYVNQFKSTRQFVHYLLGLLEEFHEIKIPIPLEERYIVFCGKFRSSFDKRTTVPKSNKIRKSTPTNPFKKIINNNDSVYLNEFIKI